MKLADVLKRLGLPSVAISIVVSIYLVGTTPISDGMPLVQYWHQHFVDSLVKPTPMDLALNDKSDIQEIVMGFEYSLDKHIDKLDDIKTVYESKPSDLMIELERWKAEKQKIENKLQDWRNKSTSNRADINMMIAGVSYPSTAE